MADNKCLARNSLSLEQGEKLAQRVKDFPCIFDKADKGHKEKDVVIMRGMKLRNLGICRKR